MTVELDRSVRLPTLASDSKTRIIFAATLRVGENEISANVSQRMPGLRESIKRARSLLQNPEAGLSPARLPGFSPEIKDLVSSFSKRKTKNDEAEKLQARSIVGVPETDIDYLNTTAIFLRDIWNFPRLTYQQEVLYAQRREEGIKAGEELRRLDSAAGDFETRRADLDKRIISGEAAELRLMNGNYRLVVSIARKLLGRGLSIDDLIQEGNRGLARSIESFDWRKGFKVSTYAYSSIFNYMRVAIRDQSRTVKLPVHKYEFLTQLNRATNDLDIELGREATIEEIAGRLDMTPEELREIEKKATRPISLDSPPADENGLSVLERTPDPGVNIQKTAERGNLRSILHESLLNLTAVKAAIVKRSVGWDDEVPRSDPEIAAQLGLRTKNRVAKLRRAAYDEMRTPALRLRVAEYLE
ncbi:MAG TPA: sigma-70 family RNA polymerase sigma factor [Patescibacteria group bacterium]|nr:sigma-70 family RNA polymerase sigma factor [Patescibacteria group bacterium]